MKDSRKQFIIEGHKAACSEWKTKIEKEFPKLFKETELVVGKWYKTNEGHLVNVSKLINLNLKAFGFGVWPEEWSDSLTWGDYKDDFTWTLATDKEVEDALIKEYEKTNKPLDIYAYHFDDCFLNGVNIKGNFYGRKEGGDTVLLMSKGKWATIIETITKAEAEIELGKTII